MFDHAASTPTASAVAVAPSVDELVAWTDQLAGVSPAGDDEARIDRITALERVKSALAAAQARETVAFRRSQLEAQRDAGVPRDQLGRGIAAQVGLARRESPHRAARLVTMAEALVDEMPHTLTALTQGEISEWRASIITTETMTLDDDQRTAADRALAPRLRSLSDRQTFAEVRRLAYQADPAEFVKRSSKAAANRRVTIRPAPDTMSIVSALLPANQGVAVYAALKTAADTTTAAGDERGRGQIMADALVARVTGHEAPPETPTEIHLVMTDRALLAADAEPAELLGYGPVPARLARDWLRELAPRTRTWLRRIYTHPTNGQLLATDSRRRLFTPAQRQALIVRDGDVCRTPWCGAPIRHADHVLAHASRGPTDLDNGQGLCSSCNHAKQAPGWRSSAGDNGAGDSVLVTTPTGHSYLSRPPPLPGTAATGPPKPFESGLTPRPDVVWFRRATLEFEAA